MLNRNQELWIRRASQHKIRTGSGSDRPNTQVSFKGFLRLVSKLLLSPWPVATAPGSDFVTNRMKFESNCINTLLRLIFVERNVVNVVSPELVEAQDFLFGKRTLHARRNSHHQRPGRDNCARR